VLADRVRERLASSPLRVEGSRIVIDTRGLLPPLDCAVATVRRLLVTEALRRSDGNQTQAAQLLGVTRSKLHDLTLRIEGRPTRPGK
jgi:DNA-binding NtrC family response regulator